jgi:hypothetical protein
MEGENSYIFNIFQGRDVGALLLETEFQFYLVVVQF